MDRIVAEAVREVPLTDAGQLDTAVFDTRVDEARTAEETYLRSLAPATGGGVTGFGPSAPAGGGVAESTRPSKNPWGRPLTETKEA